MSETIPKETIQRSLKAQLLSKCVSFVDSDMAIVQSQSNDSVYHVNYAEKTCECPDHIMRRNYCKHLQAVDIAMEAKNA